MAVALFCRHHIQSYRLRLVHIVVAQEGRSVWMLKWYRSLQAAFQPTGVTTVQARRVQKTPWVWDRVMYLSFQKTPRRRERRKTLVEPSVSRSHMVHLRSLVSESVQPLEQQLARGMEGAHGEARAPHSLVQKALHPGNQHKPDEQAGRGDGARSIGRLRSCLVGAPTLHLWRGVWPARCLRSLSGGGVEPRPVTGVAECQHV